MSPEEHAENVASLVASIPEVVAKREALRALLDKALAAVDPLECLALSSAMYLLKDPDTYSEVEDDRSSAHVEFMALSVLPLLDGRTASAPRDPTDLHAVAAFEYWKGRAVAKSIGEALGITRQLFSDTTELIYLRSMEATSRTGADVGFEEYRRETQLESLNIRGSAYPEHLSLILDGLLGPFDAECRDLMGFTATEAWSCTNAVGSLMSHRVHNRILSMHTLHDRLAEQVSGLDRAGQMPDHLAALSSEEVESYLRERAEFASFANPLALLTVTAREIAEETEVLAEEGDEAVDETAALAWLRAFTCAPTEYDSRHHHQPCGGHPLTRLPVLEVPGGYLVPSPTSLFEALRFRMEDILHDGPPDQWSKYDRHRATWVERTATERLSSALPGSVSWNGVAWASPEDESDVDGLVGCDDVGVRIQCKAGRVSAPARRGAPSMAEDVQSVINDAAHQHARLAAALATHDPESLGFTESQAAALAAALTFEVVVCLDDVTVWSTETHKLSRLVSLPDAPQVPWVLSLTDLFAVTDVLDGAELIHFLTRRLRLEVEGRISAHDELDWLGHYLSEGLFFDQHFEGDEVPDVIRLLSYTGPLDTWYLDRGGITSVPGPAPQQELPTQIRDLITRLATDMPPHWLTASLLLLNGDDEGREQLATILDHTRDRAAAVGWAAGGQVYPDYSLTVMVSSSASGPDLLRVLQEYTKVKLRPHGRPNTSAIGIGADGQFVVDIVEDDPNLTVGHVLLVRQPPPSPTSTPDEPETSSASPSPQS